MRLNTCALFSFSKCTFTICFGWRSRRGGQHWDVKRKSAQVLKEKLSKICSANWRASWLPFMSKDPVFLLARKCSKAKAKNTQSQLAISVDHYTTTFHSYMDDLKVDFMMNPSQTLTHWWDGLTSFALFSPDFGADLWICPGGKKVTRRFLDTLSFRGNVSRGRIKWPRGERCHRYHILSARSEKSKLGS